MVPATTMRIDEAGGLQALPTPRSRPRLVRSDHVSTVEFGDRLRRRCADLAGKLGRGGTITVTCATGREQLPRAMATQLGLIAAELVASAFNAFERGQGGRISVCFDVGVRTLDLTVEHSRPPPRAASCQGVAHSWLARTLVARLGGRIEHAIVIGGARTVVSVPSL
jgi:two-component sensor histidine kinase